MEEIVKLAAELGLDFFPIVYETVEVSTMHNVCAYGLPTRARHWSYGRSYNHQKTYGEMGLSKVYEVILNNNPSYAFLMDTNSEIQNLFIVAHCCGHSDFFKNNCMFKSSDRNMITHAAEHAGRIESYIERFGFEAVEHIMDIGFALDNHIDWYKGLHRKRYDKKKIIKKCQPKQEEFDDLLARDRKLIKPIKEVVQKRIPPHPEKDILWFLINYAPLEDWERDILDIIREESYYFYPQKMTKIMNEGWASYWHAELMYQYDGLSSEEYLDFVRDHEKVVQSGANPFRINPYFLGYRIFKDIEKRWDEEHGLGAGRKKIFEVRKNEDDISFLRNYLTADLVRDLNLFTFGYQERYGKEYDGVKIVEIKERMVDDIIENMVKPLYNGGAPKVVVSEIGQEGGLILKHDSEEVGTLNFKYAEKTVEYIWDLWAAPIELHALNDQGEEIALCFDELGSHIKKPDDELEFDEEELDESPRKRIIIP
jgi:stage V sporulation protein R